MSGESDSCGSAQRDATTTPPDRREDAVVDGVVMVDLRGAVTLLNPAAERLLGMSSLATLGRTLEDAQDTGELIDALRQERERVSLGRGTTRVVEIHQEGEQDLAYVRVRADVLRDHRGEAAGALFRIEDVTSDHKTDQLKNQYLSIVAHELRTPLTGIKTFSTMMAKGVLGALNERQTQVIESIREQSLRLEHQIDKLVNLGHIESNEYGQDLEEFDVVELARQSVAPFEQPAKDREITLELACPEQAGLVRGDRADLRRALQALIENAVKFTRDGGRVSVRVVFSGEDSIEVSVQDDGVGIDPRYQGRIFEKFFQVEDPLTRHHGGSGLGLFFVKSIVEAHGSSVRVDSRLGEGARFSLVLARACACDDDATGLDLASPQSAFPNPDND